MAAGKMGGAREGAGRKPSLLPLRMTRLDPETATLLVRLTVALRETMGDPKLSQQRALAVVVRRAVEEEVGEAEYISQLRKKAAALAEVE